MCTVHFSDVPSESVLFVFTVHISDVPSESVLFVCTVHISDVPSESVLFVCVVHISDVPSESVLFVCTVHISDVPSESVLFLCTIQISDTQQDDIYSSIRLFHSVPIGFMLFALLSCNFTVARTVPVPVETCNRSSFPYEFDRYEILGSHPSHKAV